MTAHDFTIWGSGLSYCTGCILPNTTLGSVVHLVYANYQNGGIHDLRLLQWAGAAGGTTGFTMASAFAPVTSMDVDGMGATACALIGSTSLGNPTFMSNSFCGDSVQVSLSVSLSGTTSSVHTANMYIGGCGFNCKPLQIGGGAGTVYESVNDKINSYGSSPAEAVVVLGSAGAGPVVNMTNDFIVQPTNGIGIYDFGPGGIVNLTNTQITLSGGTAFTIGGGGGVSVVNDNCGNKLIGVTTVATIVAGNSFLACANPAAAVGPVPTLTGTGACGTIGSKAPASVGGNAGTFACTGVTAASTITITFPYIAPNGWNCNASDQTTVADKPNQTSTTTSTCVLTTAATVQNDVISWSAAPY